MRGLGGENTNPKIGVLKINTFFCFFKGFSVTAVIKGTWVYTCSMEATYLSLVHTGTWSTFFMKYPVYLSISCLTKTKHAIKLRSIKKFDNTLLRSHSSLRLSVQGVFVIECESLLIVWRNKVTDVFNSL